MNKVDNRKFEIALQHVLRVTTIKKIQENPNFVAEMLLNTYNGTISFSEDVQKYKLLELMSDLLSEWVKTRLALIREKDAKLANDMEADKDTLGLALDYTELLPALISVVNVVLNEPTN
jgi:phosphate uptake regulator